MKKRFQQRQTDCTYTVLSHIPTIAQQLMDDFDVESIFANLQKAKHVNKENSNDATTNTASPNTPVLVNNNDVTPSPVVLVNDNNESTTLTPSSSVVLVDRPNESDSEIAKVTETTTHSRENNNESNSSNTSQESGPNSPLRSPVNTSEETDRMSKQQRLELWTEIKFKSFIRTIAAVYLETLLTLIIFIQLNLLGRYNYLYSVSLTERDKEQMITVKPYNGSLLNAVTEQKYLTCIGWFLNVGYKEIVARVSAAVESSLSSMSFKNELSYQDFVWLISEIRSKIEGADITDNDGPAHKFFNVMMPENLSDEIRILNECGGNMFDATIDSNLRKLLDETKDFIHSRDFATVLSACLKTSFNLLYQDMHHHFYYDDQSSGNRIEKNITLAKLLPHITKEAHYILNGVPPKFLETIKDCNELQALSAIIYASFDNEPEMNLQNSQN
ncbi:Peroxin-3 [Glomus cerebriforme]|uniref:Peroxin-3 n=1 Tax=Glomus cerebriforme TaxID=658196 RepID=A0A397T3K3_9GLOM|nr:Peroxin-3 [Glomus cerebriforme]